MSVMVNKPSATPGSAISNLLSMFNTTKSLASKFDTTPKDPGNAGPQFATGNFQPGQSPLGGNEMSGQIGQGAQDFQGQMDAIMRRAYGLSDGAKAAGLDSEMGGAAGGAAGVGGYGAAGEAAGAGSALTAGEGADAALALA